MFTPKWILLTITIFALSSSTAFGIETQIQGQPDNHSPFIYGGVAWSPNNETIAIGTSNGVVLHSATNLEKIGEWINDTATTSLDWDPEGQNIVIAGEDGSIQIVDLLTSTASNQFSGHSRNTVAVDWSPDGTMIASAGWDLTLRIWNSSTGVLSQSVELSYPIEYSMNWSPNSQQLAIFILDEEGGKNCIWDIETETWYLCWNHDQETSSLKWSPDGTMIATCGGDRQISIWDATTGELLYMLETPYVADSLSWSPDSSRLASNSSDGDEGTTQVWDISTQEPIAEFQGILLIGDAFYSNTLAWSPDGSLLTSVSDDGKIYLWNMETYEQIAIYEGYSPINLSD